MMTVAMMTMTGAAFSPSAVRTWLETDDPVREQELFAQARAITRRHFGTRVTLYAPLYLSNLCVNNCLYCAFRRENPLLVRRALRPGELRAEAAAIAAMGHRTVVLVAGEHPRQAGEEAIAVAVATVRTVPAIRDVQVEVMPLTVAGYRQVSEAGAGMVVVYQETYDRAVYAQAHPSGPKTDYEWRLGALTRALRAGFRRVGMGVLLGLGDVAEDSAALIAHARAFQTAWDVWPTISLPRLQPATGAPWALSPPRPVTDRVFLRLLAVIRMALPKSRITLSTRESPRLRDLALRLGVGVTQVSAGSRTDVGGYAGGRVREILSARPPGQFAIQDERPVPAITGRLKTLGYQPVWYQRGLRA